MNLELNWEKVPPVLAHLACDIEKSEELNESAKIELDILLSSIR